MGAHRTSLAAQISEVTLIQRSLGFGYLSVMNVTLFRVCNAGTDTVEVCWAMLCSNLDTEGSGVEITRFIGGNDARNQDGRDRRVLTSCIEGRWQKSVRRCQRGWRAWWSSHATKGPKVCWLWSSAPDSRLLQDTPEHVGQRLSPDELVDN